MGEIGHSSKPGSACSNTESDVSSIDFRIAVPLTPPYHGSDPSPHSTMRLSNLDTVVAKYSQHF